eukprot:TRINITY_DN4131_c0_g1_i1.p1 TRINITY_DN4131_c0_g1~~TRINITY_DN4131_c0_g1_i1.p1  ORF type:complete len:888 (+),score=102.47 TRINITY_DN4131_c0_g1_i1:24-2666(+)
MSSSSLSGIRRGPPPSGTIKSATTLRLTEYSHRLESLDYDPIDSVLHVNDTYEKTKRDFVWINVGRWVITFLIGVFVGSIAFLVDYAIRFLTTFKFHFTREFYHTCDNCVWLPLVFLMTVNVVLVAMGSFLVTFIEPVAKGSGIPEVKAYLNGIKIPHLMRLKTLLAKAFGVLFSVAGGLAAGKEGPMIHVGSVVAGAISQGKSTSFGISLPEFTFLRPYRNDYEKRDFVSGGAAAGVAAAFGAPVGGVLFALEEGASFWNQQLTWRTFFCAMVSTFTLNFWLSGASDHAHFGDLSSPGLINFGSFETRADYSILHIPFFLILGVLGGGLGAAFNGINAKITALRLRYVSSNLRRLLEALSVAIVTVLIVFFFSYFVHTCVELPPKTGNATKESETDPHTFDYFCPDGYFNDMATIWFVSSENAIKELLHTDTTRYSVTTLSVFACVYFLLATWTYGIAVSNGLFVPVLLTGAAYGRLFGVLVHYVFPSLVASPGTFALIGAASFLGGVVRMTISLCVILMEATGNIEYGLPLMLTLMVAKWTGDWFNHGIYDIHIELAHVPVLEWEGPVLMRKFTAEDVMARPVVCFDKVEKVDNIFTVLQATTHNGFPIVDSAGTLIGLILRSQLISILKNKPFQQSTQKRKRFYGLMKLGDFYTDYPTYPPLEDVELTASERASFVDLSPFIHNSPYTLYHKAVLTRAFIMFRTLGLRHLVVVNHQNHVLGMITRQDLAHPEDTIRTNRHHARLHALRTPPHASRSYLDLLPTAADRSRSHSRPRSEDFLEQSPSRSGGVSWDQGLAPSKQGAHQEQERERGRDSHTRRQKKSLFRDMHGGAVNAPLLAGDCEEGDSFGSDSDNNNARDGELAPSFVVELGARADTL